jgi:hypothetical protein
MLKEVCRVGLVGLFCMLITPLLAAPKTSSSSVCLLGESPLETLPVSFATTSYVDLHQVDFSIHGASRSGLIDGSGTLHLRGAQSTDAKSDPGATSILATSSPALMLLALAVISIAGISRLDRLTMSDPNP